ncbi:MAG: hypothetical protein S4CHLAM45_01740 [Chlamydiales bacterium]|nr:hypothetical protein [Chlamydiales bacterium]MCH9619493.1 hypothetical protein [Chlamydiales bacterium]MCH9622297.1 hypothetical protein [Chlamydiales bacterium]
MRAIIISASSDIGEALAKDWIAKGWEVTGTYRSSKPSLPIEWVHCDLADLSSVKESCKQLQSICWDTLVIAPGDLEPIGDFKDVDFDAWEEGIQVNLLRQLRLLHHLLPSRNIAKEPSVLFFAGGGVNNAVVHYSSYTLSKVALIKMCEFLDAEIPDTRFVIIGPGVVKTKIHTPTLTHGAKAAGANYQRTFDRLKNNECTPMEEVVDCCTWAVTTKSPGVRGRNFSVVADQWGDEMLEKELENDGDMYKLRRHKNSWRPEEVECL